MNETIIPIIERLDKIESLIKKTNTTDDKLMTIKMVAEYSSMSEMSVYRAVQRGSLNVLIF